VPFGRTQTRRDRSVCSRAGRAVRSGRRLAANPLPIAITSRQRAGGFLHAGPFSLSRGSAAWPVLLVCLLVCIWTFPISREPQFGSGHWLAVGIQRASGSREEKYEWCLMVLRRKWKSIVNTANYCGFQRYRFPAFLDCCHFGWRVVGYPKPFVVIQLLLRNVKIYRINQGRLVWKSVYGTPKATFGGNCRTGSQTLFCSATTFFWSSPWPAPRKLRRIEVEFVA